MRSPRTPGAGISGARKSLGGDPLHLTEAGPDAQRCFKLALHLDRHADAGLFLRWQAAVERLAHRAAELRV